tara:strand:+ start:578 stop:1648 length:1071 start_codon:yes stop_codon:yes gene_type:complete
MCGIFGYAKKHNAQNDNQIDKLKEVLTYLADESVVRGQDSTGISMMTPNSRQTYKATAPSSEVVQHDAWESIILERVNRDSTIVIGHVRLATHGAVTERNAHPFEIGEVVGAHNGVIYNYNKLADKYNKTIEVDSEVIFASLNNNPMDKALEQLEGDFAVSWVKESNKIINLARESSRPLHVAYWKKARILLWASTEEILKSSLKRAGLNLKHNELESERIYSFDTDMFERGYKPTKTMFKPKEKSTPRYTRYTPVHSHSAYDWIDDYSYTDDKVSKDDKVRCETCFESFTIEHMIDIDDTLSMCVDCYDSVQECDWCGDWMFNEESTSFNKWSVCKLCKPDVDNQLRLSESCATS